MEYGFSYPRGKKKSFTIYIDVDWKIDVDDRNTTSGGSFFLGESLFPWLRKKEVSISLSKFEA